MTQAAQQAGEQVGKFFDLLSASGEKRIRSRFCLEMFMCSLMSLPCWPWWLSSNFATGGYEENNGDLQLLDFRYFLKNNLTVKLTNVWKAGCEGQTTRFALACNISSKIIEPIQPGALFHFTWCFYLRFFLLCLQFVYSGLQWLWHSNLKCFCLRSRCAILRFGRISDEVDLFQVELLQCVVRNLKKKNMNSICLDNVNV